LSQPFIGFTSEANQLDRQHHDVVKSEQIVVEARPFQLRNKATRTGR